MTTLLTEIKSDLKTYNGRWSEQGFWALSVHRYGKWRYKFENPIVRKPLSLIYKILYKLIQILTLIELPCEAEIGKGTRIDHFGPIIISGYAKLGKNCVLRNGVTIGIKKVGENKAPQIGNNVDIGCGAVIIGDIKIGNNVLIGANSVVTKDVEENCTVVGVPTKVIKR